MAETNVPARTASCNACREAIHPEARVCHHCGATQQPSFWKPVSDALKWTGGVVTVISLVVGTITLAGYYSDWRARRSVVHELVAASKWLIRAEHYQRAWEAYAEALALNPGSASVRDGRFELAKIWLRDFRVEKESANRLLTEISTVLYRGLPDATPREAATILAHMGWVQVQRAELSLPVRGDIDILFQEALEHDEDNPYANAMYAYWILMRRETRDADTVREQVARFDRALLDPNLRDFVRPLQFRALREQARGEDDDRSRVALAAFLHAARSMQQGGEPRPPKRTLDHINIAYGTAKTACNVEASLDMLPLDEHLALHRWLFGDVDGLPDETFGPQARYVRARLLEANGERAAALAGYRGLIHDESAQKWIDALVDAAIERLTGQLPERALARTYINDPVDEDDPWAFHLDTLRHFEAKFQPPNFDQAVEFFSEAAARSDARLAELEPVLGESVERVRAVVREGEEIERVGAFTSGFSIGHYESAIRNLVLLVALRAEVSWTIGEVDRSLAMLSDLAHRVEELDDDWKQAKALVSYQLARAHAKRAQADTSGEAPDVELALTHLDAAVERGIVAFGLVGWEEIKGPDFASLRGEPRYRELIRGR